MPQTLPAQHVPQPQYVQPPQHAGMVSGSHAPYGQVVVKPKSPILHLLASFFIPGLGQMLNGQVGKGLLFFAAYFVGVMLSFVLIGIPIMIVVNIWGLVDAYRGAQARNARHGIIS